jgi:sugar phosphate isomerase/epimerase
MPISCAIVADELSSDPLTAFELGMEWGVRHFELRGVHSGRVPSLEPHTIHRVRRAVRDFGVAITVISPGLFKFAHPDDVPMGTNIEWMERGFYESWANGRRLLDDHLDTLLPASIDFADQVGASMIVGFGFSRGGRPAGAPPQAVVDTLGKAAERARAAGKTLLLETEEGFWADTAARSAALVRAVGAGLGINWDPANVLREGDASPVDDYRQIAPFVRNLHFKDARRSDGAGVFVADGEVDWATQMELLVRDGYDGCIAVEPHLSPSVASVRHGLKRLRSLVAAATGAPSP